MKYVFYLKKKMKISKQEKLMCNLNDKENYDKQIKT